MKFKKPMIVFFLEFLPNGRGREIGYTTQNTKDCIPDDKFKVDEILFTWNIISNDFIYNGERLGELKMKIVQLPDKDQMFKISKEMEKEREEDWNKNVVSIVNQFTKI